MTNQALIQDATRNGWLLFEKPREVISVDQVADVIPALKHLSERVDKYKLHAAGFISYEAAPAFDEAFVVRVPNKCPLLWFGLYSGYRRTVLPPPGQGAHKIDLPWTPTVTTAEYQDKLAIIKQHLARGDSYQVNYTYRLRAPFSGSPSELFLALVYAQQADFGAYIDTGRCAICSASPELFFSLHGTEITCCPMKGTAARGLAFADDQTNGEQLRRSPKNQAENVMIVDMIRNDLARIGRVGSITVTDLFAVKRYHTLWQMTSTVKAATDAGFCEIMTALFPCASITGCPKPRTTEIIAALETTPRGVYTGCIGYLGPGRQAQFNIAIRTVVVDREEQQAEYGVGGGIVWDSVGEDEHQECRIKAKVLTEKRLEFSLLETMLWTRNDGYFLLPYHLRRVAESAAYFEITLDLAQVCRMLEQYALAFSSAQRVRLLVAQDGTVSIEAVGMTEQPAGQRAIVALSPEPVNCTDRFLYHKTTHRYVYDRARESLPDGDDVVLWNERGEITESCNANIVVELEGRLLTPPVSSGLLPGTFRASLLEQGKIHEAVLSKQAFAQASRIFLINSVRKWREAVLEECLQSRTLEKERHSCSLLSPRAVEGP